MLDDDGATKFQGEFIASIGHDFYLVQLFSWMDGSATTQHVVRLSEVASDRYRIFDNVEDMRTYYEIKGRHQDEAIRKRRK